MPNANLYYREENLPKGFLYIDGPRSGQIWYPESSGRYPYILWWRENGTITKVQYSPITDMEGHILVTPSKLKAIFPTGLGLLCGLAKAKQLKRCSDERVTAPPDLQPTMRRKRRPLADAVEPDASSGGRLKRPGAVAEVETEKEKETLARVLALSPSCYFQVGAGGAVSLKYLERSIDYWGGDSETTIDLDEEMIRALRGFVHNV